MYFPSFNITRIIVHYMPQDMFVAQNYVNRTSKRSFYTIYLYLFFFISFLDTFFLNCECITYWVTAIAGARSEKRKPFTKLVCTTTYLYCAGYSAKHIICITTHIECILTYKQLVATSLKSADSSSLHMLGDRMASHTICVTNLFSFFPHRRFNVQKWKIGN